MNDTVIIMPAYNEAGGIAGIIGRVTAAVPGADIVVVDDGSSDGTASAAASAGARVLRLPFNLGYGGALQTGFRYAIDAGYSYAVQMDADGQHDPAYVAALLEPVREGRADVALGSRFLGVGQYRTTFARGLGMRLFGGIAGSVIGRRVTDPTTGYQALNRRALRFYASDNYPVDFPDADVLIMLHRAGLTSVEVPVLMHQRASGESMHSGLKPVYYVFKMFLSIFVTLLRKNRFRDEAGN